MSRPRRLGGPPPRPGRDPRRVPPAAGGAGVGLGRRRLAGVVDRHARGSGAESFRVEDGREIAVKGEESRFRKVDRGAFVATAKAGKGA